MAKKTQRQKKCNLIEIKRKFGTNPDGTPRRRSFYGKSKALAEAEYEAALKNLLIEEATEYKDTHGDSDITFEAWAKKWLNIKWGSVRNISYDKTYEAPTEKKLIPMFGKRQLKSITKSELQLYLNNLNRYSFSECHNIRLCLKEIFTSAVDEHLIIHNPTKDLRIPKSAADRVIIKRAYTYEQARRVIEYAKTHKYGIDVLLMLKAGLRRSELLVLPYRFKDEQTGGIDLKNDVIHVRQSISESKYGVEIAPCKSLKSKRNIPIDKELKAILKSIPDKTDYRKKEYTRKYIVCSGYGDHYIPSNYDRRYSRFSNDFQKYCKENKIDIPALTPHELRHSFGSILYERGVDILTISKLMGHASVETTAKLYVHENEEVNRNAINTLL